MESQAVACPSCSFENHTTCRFCIKCGKELPGAAGVRPKPKGAADPSLPRAAATPTQETQQLLKRIAEESGYASKSTPSGWSVDVPLEGERKQKVHVLFDGHDREGNDVVSFLSLCGLADERHAMKLLQHNSRMTYCSYAVRPIRKKDYFVVTATQLASTADMQELRKTLEEVARHADRLEAQLGGGEDKL